MKKLTTSFVALFAIIILSSCGGGGENGQLIGVLERPAWNGINPYGMVYVPSGTLHIGQSDQDVFQTHLQRPKSISIHGFYMDDTEITNNEYRQFTHYVRDSIAHGLMGDFKPNYNDTEEILDWEYELDYTDETLDDMYYQGDEAFSGKREFDVSGYNYKYQFVDWRKAASQRGNGGEPYGRASLIVEKEVNIFPDTLVWIRDFSYSYNEPMARNYFWHPAYDDYPIVGVSWKQAQAFNHWRTKSWDDFKAEDEPNTEKFRLPFEAEWEYAARGGRAHAPYPWGGYYVRNAKGCLLANFKPGRGNYPEDGGYYTVKADAYFPNDYGLYCMSGNVAEWTENSYVDNAYSFEHDLNSAIVYDAKDDDPDVYKRKVIRGGSWKDISYFLQTGTRHWEFQDTTKSYIGFRSALTFLGRSINDFN
jgi:gliding motility-associated lipoprotein GldK